MAGRPLGLKSLALALARYSKSEIQKIVDSIPTEDNRVARLKKNRDKLVRKLAMLDSQIAKLSGGNGAVAAPTRRGRKPRRKKGYTLSAATRRKMSEAAKRRYASATKPEAPAVPVKRTRKPFSAETRAKMAAAQQARWAKVKGTAQPTT